jgi:hypothetical protein
MTCRAADVDRANRVRRFTASGHHLSTPVFGTGRKPCIAQTDSMIASAIAATGIASALQRFDASAARTAADPLANLEGETVERLQVKVAVEANVAVLRASDDMTGALLDILA